MRARLVMAAAPLIVGAVLLARALHVHLGLGTRGATPYGLIYAVVFPVGWLVQMWGRRDGMFREPWRSGNPRRRAFAVVSTLGAVATGVSWGLGRSGLLVTLCLLVTSGTAIGARPWSRDTGDGAGPAESPGE